MSEVYNPMYSTSSHLKLGGALLEEHRALLKAPGAKRALTCMKTILKTYTLPMHITHQTRNLE
eukprot:5935070-Pyramimonas_sp.AAC.1